METPPPQQAMSSNSRKAWSADTPVFIRVGVLGMAITAVFGAGVWATNMSNAIAQLSASNTKQEIKMDRMEGLLQDMIRGQIFHRGTP